MGKSKRSGKHRPKQKARPQSKWTLLDQYSADDFYRWKNFGDKYLKFHWDYYNSLAYQRSKIMEELKRSLREAATPNFEFIKWQRVLRYRYSLKPFSVAGSLVDPGGRFNIGDINPSQFAPFPALYVAAHKDTALQELLCQKIEAGKEEQALDFALVDATSITNVSLSGRLDSIIDLRESHRLQPFIDLIKNFTIPDHLIKTAKEIGERIDLIKTVPVLTEALLIPHWRLWPMQFDVPAASQILGQLVADAGIEGILYPSKFTSRECLAIFPQNFHATDSFVELDDEPPSENNMRRLDGTTWSTHQDELL